MANKSSDYLLASTRKTTATGLSELVEGAISHDQITRFLAGEELNGKFLWLKIKKPARQYENGEGCLIFDDTIAGKAYMDKNEIICWYYDLMLRKKSITSHVKTKNLCSKTFK
ncbi:MAG: hypothetical protein LBC27_02300 [Spirochaetaceae bacterium]|nr:hypothetical protein [Spirochaetaceae bacterium]